MKRRRYKRATGTVSAVSIPDPVLRSNFHTTLVVGADKTPSGTRYEFQAGQQQPVKNEDKDFLLSLNRQQGSGCCGGTARVLHYFEEV